MDQIATIVERVAFIVVNHEERIVGWKTGARADIMTIDERLDRLTERHDALIRNIKLWAAENKRMHEQAMDKLDAGLDELDARLDKLAATVERLAGTAGKRTERIERLADGSSGNN